MCLECFHSSPALCAPPCSCKSSLHPATLLLIVGVPAQVFALWVSTGLKQPEVTGVHVFSFAESGKIDNVAAFREPVPREKDAHLRSAA
jgi:hypothetical protein